jgi:hypothetical protein
MAQEFKVLGIADSYTDAEAMIQALHNAGFPLDRISALLNDKSATADFAHDHSTRYPEGAINGATSGSVLGGALGLLAGIGLSAIPGLGPIIGTGPLMGALSGVAFGGLAGALVGFGMPEMHAKTYERELHAGHLLLAIHVQDANRAAQAAEVLSNERARHVQRLPAADGPQ